MCVCVFADEQCSIPVVVVFLICLVLHTLQRGASVIYNVVLMDLFELYLSITLMITFPISRLWMSLSVGV